ncbi:hypothetical protein GALMADRAFT_219568 [Galerina marginata CBS 339.88]|uniref:AAA+ ATPase domain-containing protein n=1 Tax=Galerina marginata (strain CBS 339.88) TaxID=685588 RepID=A0A067TN27_GALM3|nr:hypothetical protein GALMADRAFT_219568 [Galerina marginata CBS 339.88]
MASDSSKRKGAVAIPKAQASAAKLTLKQKTLFDSFLVKNAPKANATQPLVVDVDGPEEVSKDDIANPSETNHLVGPPPKVAFPPARAVADSLTIGDLTGDPNDRNVEESVVDATGGMDRRSPSTVIVKDEEPPQINYIRPRQTNLTTEGHTPDQPIIIASSPIRGPFTMNKPVHPFFISKPKPFAPLMRASAPTKKSKAISEAQAPAYPTRASQHVRGPQSVFQDTGLPFSRKTLKQPEQIPEEHTGYGFLKRHDTVADEPGEPSIYRTSDNANEPSSYNVPEEHTSNHPAIARLVNRGPGSSPVSRRPWSEKWRPSCAQEVLGNEKSATFLRNWLRALELQLEDNLGTSGLGPQKSDDTNGKPKSSTRGTKRARIVRAVEKRRKRSRLDSDEEDDSWIAYSDEEDEEVVNYEEIDDILPEVPASSQSSATHDFQPSPIDNKEEGLGQLHNTILLSGPSGSGKTACVYACAEELGWDVFEVYPGVGRRNGANVDNLIGEVGKNHLVLQNRQNNDILKSFLSKKKYTGAASAEDTPSMDSILQSYSPRKKSTSKDTPEPGDSVDSMRPIRQSLILLEEVDILFKEDINFWTTVTRIIKECKRPVICTCNDISLVPIADLPLQSIIRFAPCPVDVTTWYLQALCSAEGYTVNQDSIAELYGHLPIEQELAGAFPSSDPPAPDLRRTINALQVACSTLRDFHFQTSDRGGQGLSHNFGAKDAYDGALSTTGPVVRKQPRICMKKSDFLSYLDGNLVQNRTGRLMEAELGRYRPSDDDEIGHTILYDIYAKDRPDLGHYDRQEDMICSATDLLFGLFDVDVRKDDASSRSIEDESKKIRVQQTRILQEISPMSRDKGGLWFDYLPYLRQMVAAEDVEEARAMEKRRRVGRRTRNSGRSGYVRTIELTEEARRGLGETGFNIVEGA